MSVVSQAYKDQVIESDYAFARDRVRQSTRRWTGGRGGLDNQG